MITAIRALTLIVALGIQVPNPIVPPTQAAIDLNDAVRTLADRIDYLLDLIEQLKIRMDALEVRTITMQCRVTVAGIPVSCKLQ